MCKLQETEVSAVLTRLKRFGGPSKANKLAADVVGDALTRCKQDLAFFVMGVEVPNVAEPLVPSVFGDFATS